MELMTDLKEITSKYYAKSYTKTLKNLNEIDDFLEKLKSKQTQIYESKEWDLFPESL